MLKFCLRLLLSQSRVWLFVTPGTAACQVFLSFTISWSLLKLMSTESMTSSNHLILCCPLLLLSSTFSSIRSFSISLFFASSGPSIRASESLLSMNIQGWFSLGLTAWSPCCPRDSQEPSPAPQFESICSLALSLPHGPTLRSIHDYWKNHSFN